MFNGNMGQGLDDLVMRRRVGAPPPSNGGNPMGRGTMPIPGMGQINPLFKRLFEGSPVQGPTGNHSPNDFMRASGQKPVGGSGFNPYAAGRKQYGASPNRGPMRDKTPFQERDINALNQRNAMLKRLQARSQGRFMTPENLRNG